MVATAKLSIQVKNKCDQICLETWPRLIFPSSTKDRKFIYHYERGQGATTILHIVYCECLTLPPGIREGIVIVLFC